MSSTSHLHIPAQLCRLTVLVPGVWLRVGFPKNPRRFDFVVPSWCSHHCHSIPCLVGLSSQPTDSNRPCHGASSPFNLAKDNENHCSAWYPLKNSHGGGLLGPEFLQAILLKSPTVTATDWSLYRQWSPYTIPITGDLIDCLVGLANTVPQW